MSNYKKIIKLKRKVNRLEVNVSVLKKSKCVKKMLNDEKEVSGYYKYMTQRVMLLFLKNKTIKITNPLNFNDPMDSTIPDIKVQDFYLKKAIREALTQEHSQIIKKFKIKLEEEIDSGLPSFKHEMEDISLKLQEDWSELISNYRVLSLTTKNNNLLMWSHYADEHRGMVVKFRKKLSFGEPKKVDYYNGPQMLNNVFNSIFYAIIKDGAINGFPKEQSDLATDLAMKAMSRYFFMKMSEWEYENEHRIIYESDHERVRKINEKLDVLDVLDADIECIYLGSSISLLKAKRLTRIIKTHLPNTSVIRMKRVGWSLQT